MKQPENKSPLYVASYNPEPKERKPRYFLRAVRATKWYWWIPIVYLFCMREMSMWVFRSEEEIERGWRSIITELLMFPTIFCGFWLYCWIESFFN